MEHEKTFLIILDEMQELTGKRRGYLNRPVLYQLTRLTEGEMSHLWDGSLTVIGVSNANDIMSHIDDDIASSLEGPTIINFPRYTGEEIADILEERQSQAYREELMSKAALKKIAN